jgi:hypothetical protein
VSIANRLRASTVPLSKQRAVETYLGENTDYFDEKYAARVDRQLTQGCIKERPDFIFDLGDKMMVVEVVKTLQA